MGKLKAPADVLLQKLHFGLEAGRKLRTNSFSLRE